MPRLWPDPRDSGPERPFWLWSILVSLAVIAIASVDIRVPS